MRVDRTSRVLDAILRRISDRGDMHIPVPYHCLQVLIRAGGFHWEMSGAEAREVDALALELLVRLIQARRAVA